MTTELHPASASAVLKMFKTFQKKYPNAYMGPLKDALEKILGHESEITTKALRLRLERLHGRYFQLWHKLRCEMDPEV